MTRRIKTIALTLTEKCNLNCVYCYEHRLEQTAKFAKENGFTEECLMPWDFSFYAEKHRIEKYDLSDEHLKPYFQLEHCINAIFDLANRLYGLTFNEMNDIPVYHKNVKVYDIKDSDGSHLALFYADFFPRESKRGGAWMTEFRGQRIYKGTDERPLISIVTNFTKPTADTPSLITHDELTTLLHEFGHALHGILTKGKYESMTGTSVDHDFVELPSQIMENWCYEPEYLNTFAKHYKTGETIPADLIEKIVLSMNYQSAYFHIRQLQFGILDMAWHTLTEPFNGDVITFGNEAMQQVAVLPTVPNTQMETAFTHIFSGGYAAGYYSYKWSEVLDADAFSVFKNKGIFSKKAADSFRKNILERGGTEPAMTLYKRFRGQEPTIDALMIRDGIKK